MRDVAIGKLAYGANCPAIDYDGCTRYLRITDIKDTGGLNEDAKSPSVISEKYVLTDGDILFARSGATVGKTYRYRQTDGRALYAGYLIRLTPNRSIVLPDYLFWYTKTDFYKSFLEHAQRAVAQPNINAQQYGSLEILLPPLDAQRSFVVFVNHVDKLRFDSLAAHMIMGQICAAANDATFACAPGSCCMCTKMRFHSAKSHFGAQRSCARCTDNAGRWGTD